MLNTKYFTLFFSTDFKNSYSKLEHAYLAVNAWYIVIHTVHFLRSVLRQKLCHGANKFEGKCR